MNFIRNLGRGSSALAGGLLLLAGSIALWILSGTAGHLAAVEAFMMAGGAFLAGVGASLLRRSAAERAESGMREIERAGQFSTFTWDPAAGRLRWSQRPRFVADDCPFTAWSDMLHPADRETTMKAFGELATVPSDYEVEFRLQPENGTTRWLLLRATSYAPSRAARPLVVGALIDISEHCQAEELVRETALEVVVNDLASSLGDTINNSLAALTNTMYLLQRDAHLNVATKQYLLDIAMVELARLGRVSKNMLGLSGAEAPAPDDVAHPTFTLDLRPDLRS